MEDNEIKYKFADIGFDRLKVRGAGLERTATRGAYLTIRGDDFYVTKENAPEIVLAILRAAGWRGASLDMDGLSDEGRIACVIEFLDAVVSRAETKKREDLELAQLKVEALALYNAVFGKDVDHWPTGYAVDPWIAAAKKARVMHRTETGADQP